MIEVPSDVLEAIGRMGRPTLCGHVVPDADCVGSLLAMADAMARAGRQPRVVLPAADVSLRLRFLLELVDVAPVEAPDDQADWIVALDTAAARRINTGPAKAPLPPAVPVLNIDHHDTNDSFGRVNWVVPDASSTSELVASVIEAMGWPLSPAQATLLYAGLVEDTLGFLLPTVSGRTLRAAAGLIEAGADVGSLGDRLARSQSSAEFKLMQTVYGNTRQAADGQIAYATISHAELAASGCTPADIDNQVAVPRSLRDARIAILFSEGEPGNVRINFRGKDGVAVLPLAKRFNGGGHAESAGARVLDRPMAEVVAEVLAAAVEHVRSLPDPPSRLT